MAEQLPTTGAGRWRGGPVSTRLRSGLGAPVLLVGLGGGAVGAAYLSALHMLARWIGPRPGAAHLHAVLLVGAGVVIAAVGRALGPSGDVELLVDNIHVLGGAEDVRQLRSLLPASLVSIGAGGTMGPEAPLVQTTGSLGTWIAARFGLGPHEMRVLTITGMAAGFSVLFGAPVGAALFALEILHRRGLQYYEALVPALVGSLVGYSVNFALTGVGLAPVWHLPAPGRLHGGDLLWGVACGLVGGVGAWVFTWLVAGARRATGWIPAGLLPIVGGAALAGLALWSPFALTNGEAQVDQLVSGRLGLAALGVAATAKLAGVLVTLTGRWKGGFIIPLFFVGMAGGQLLHALVPASNVTVLMVGLAVALCVGVTKTPLGSTLVVTQMAGLAVLPMALVAAIVALVVTGRASLIETQRPRTSLGELVG